MNELRVYDGSSMVINLENAWRANKYQFWLTYLKNIDGVIDATCAKDSKSKPYTLITFKSDTYKNLFILRWS